jgi:hypothetical protein
MQKKDRVKNSLGLIDATSLVAGSMIGSEFYCYLCHGERYWISGMVISNLVSDGLITVQQR